MKFFFDLFPIILFFVAYKFAGIYVATAVAIAATAAQIGWLWLRRRKIDGMLWASLVIICLFGGATLLLHDETFIKWKPTVLYWLFSLVLLFSATIMKKNLIRAMLEKQVSLPEPMWARLNAAWAAFFAFMGAANLFVAFYYAKGDTGLWVDYKLFGTVILMIVFIIGQSIFLAKHIEEKP